MKEITNCFWFLVMVVLLMQNIFAQNRVITGADRIVSDQFDLIKNKSLAIVTNHTAVLSNGRHLVDTLYSMDDVKIKVLFGPEHGIRGDAPDGKVIADGKDLKTGLPVFSLYGKIRKPTPEMLKGVDIILFDIQDIGARFYTFISTMFYCIEAASENNIQILILDRPNPIGGLKVDGPLRDDSLKSFVAIAPVPVMHGMTVGELAIMFNEELWIESEKRADLRIVTLIGWNRKLYFDECGLPWLNPSPNIPSLDAAIVYPGICFLEGTNISEGRGTLSPFLTIGSPYINSSDLIKKIDEFSPNGINYSTVEFTPVSIEGMSTSPKYLNEKCYGLKLSLTNRETFDPVKFGIIVLYSVYSLYPEKFEFRQNWIDKLFGKPYLRRLISEGKRPEEIFSMWENELTNFKKMQAKYLLY